MKRSSLRDYPCSIARAADVAGEWWTPLILRDIVYGIRRFRELEVDLGISANVLSDRLATLVGEGVLEPRVYQQRPERSEYFLTEKGLDLLPTLLTLMRWGDQWTWAGTPAPVRVVHECCGTDVTVEIRCPHCDRAAAPTELRAKLTKSQAQPLAEHDPGYVSGQRLGATNSGVGLG